jgi:hypothetical protein
VITRLVLWWFLDGEMDHADADCLEVAKVAMGCDGAVGVVLGEPFAVSRDVHVGVWAEDPIWAEAWFGFLPSGLLPCILGGGCHGSFSR